MQTPLVLLAALTLGLARADYLDREDVPSQCQDICRPVVEISDSCDAQHDDDDQELSCICNANNMSTQIPECELCIRPFHQQDDDDDFDAILDLLNDCRFTALQQTGTTTAGGASASTVSTEVNGTPTTSVVPSQQTGGSGGQGNGAGNLAAGVGLGAIAAGVAIVGGAL